MTIWFFLTNKHTFWNVLEQNKKNIYKYIYMGVIGMFFSLNLKSENKIFFLIQALTKVEKKNNNISNIYNNTINSTLICLMMIATKINCAGFKNVILLNLCIKKYLNYFHTYEMISLTVYLKCFSQISTLLRQKWWRDYLCHGVGRFTFHYLSVISRNRMDV